MLWHFTLKGIEELNSTPNPFLSFQMLLIRLAHLKNMPDPQALTEQDFDDDDESELHSASPELIEESGVSRTQIKNTIQEKKEVQKTKPDILNINLQMFVKYLMKYQLKKKLKKKKLKKLKI